MHANQFDDVQDTRRDIISPGVARMLSIEHVTDPISIMNATWKNKYLYSERHGYSLIDGSSAINRNLPHAWSKMNISLSLLELPWGDHSFTAGVWPMSSVNTSAMPEKEGGNTKDRRLFDWVMYLDADTLFTNSDVSLSMLLPATGDGDFVIAEDMHGLNSGVWLVRNNPWTRNMLLKWSSMEEFVTVCKYSAFCLKRSSHSLLSCLATQFHAVCRCRN